MERGRRVDAAMNLIVSIPSFNTLWVYPQSLCNLIQLPSFLHNARCLMSELIVRYTILPRVSMVKRGGRLELFRDYRWFFLIFYSYFSQFSNCHKYVGQFPKGLYYNNKVESLSNCSTYQGNPNFFVLQGGIGYLEAWLDWEHLPPRKIAFPADPEPMSIASELYDIINSRVQPHSQSWSIFVLCMALLNGTSKRWTRWSTGNFMEASKRCGSSGRTTFLKHAVDQSGLLKGSAKVFGASLMCDFGAWMCMHPDMYDIFFIVLFGLCGGAQKNNQKK